MPCHIVGLMNRKYQSRHVLSDIAIGAVVLFLENTNTNTIDAHWKLRNEFLGSVPEEHENHFRQGMRYGFIKKIYGVIDYNFDIESIDELNMLTLFQVEEELYRTKGEETKRERERLKEIENYKEKERQKRLSLQIKTEEDISILDVKRRSIAKEINSGEQQLNQILIKINRLDSNQANATSLDELGYQLTQILLSSIKISKSTESILNNIVVAYLNVDDVSKITDIIEKITNKGIELTKLLDRLKKIQSEQKGIHIDDISDPYLLSTLAKLHKDVKAYKRAYRLYTKSYAINPQNSYTLNGLGSVCRMLTLYEEGINNYLLAYKTKGNKVQITNTGMGALLLDMSDSEKNSLKAENLLLEALNLEDSPYTHNALGRLYMERGEMDKAEQHFFLASDINFLFKLVENHEKSKNIKKVINCLNRILELDFKNEKANQIMKLYTKNEIV